MSWRKESSQEGRQAKGEVLRLRLCRLSHEEVRLAFLALQSVSSWGSSRTQMPLQLSWEVVATVAKNDFQKPEKSLADSSGSREDGVCYLLSPKTCRGTSRVPPPPPEQFHPTALSSLGASPWLHAQASTPLFFVLRVWFLWLRRCGAALRESTVQIGVVTQRLSKLHSCPR